VFLEFSAGGKQIGDTIAAAAGGEVRIVGEALSRNQFGRAELVHNGRVVHAVDARMSGGHYAADLEFTVRVAEPGWLALRVPRQAGQNEFGRELFAHTSPIYVEVGGRRIFRADVAQQLLAEMGASQEAIKSKAIFASDGEREAVMGVYRDAVDSLQRRIEQNR
jgi:hypothetical protein